MDGEIPSTKQCRNASRLQVYKLAPMRRVVILSVAAVLYALVLPYVYNTCGEPLRRAKLELEEFEKERAFKEPVMWRNTHDNDDDLFGWDDDSNRPGLWDDEEDDDDFNQPPAPVEIETIRSADDEDAAVEVSENNSTEDEDDDDEVYKEPRPLPNWFLPDAGAAAALFALLTGTILFNLMGHWFVWFKTKMYFESCSTYLSLSLSPSLPLSL